MLIDAHHHLAGAKYCPYVDSYSDKINEMAEKYAISYMCMMGMGDDFEDFADNKTVLTFSRKNKYVLPVAYIDLDNDTVDTVKKYDELGFAGYKAINSRKPYNSDDYLKIYEAITETKKYIYFHCGMQGGASTRFVDSHNSNPIFLDRIVNMFPDLNIICAHLGYPWLNEALGVAAYHSNVYYDLTGGAMELDLEWFSSNSCLYKLLWEKVVFGTDSMIGDFAIPYGNYLTKIKEAGLNKEKSEDVLANNMQALLRPNTINARLELCVKEF